MKLLHLDFTVKFSLNGNGPVGSTGLKFSLLKQTEQVPLQTDYQVTILDVFRMFYGSFLLQKAKYPIFVLV